MKGKKQLKRRNAVSDAALFAQQPCPECGERGKHFVPPSLGEDGFYVCAFDRATEALR
jgi:hypothetical protein